MGGVAQAANDLPGGGINAEALSRHVRLLASDEFEGRAPASAGEQRTVDYLVEQFKAAGLEPGGEQGGWTQAVPLVRAQVDGPVRASVRVGGKTQALVNGNDVILQSLRPQKAVALKNAPLVFVGYGISAPERQWDDYKGVDLRGKIAVVLINDADFESPQPGAFDGKAVTYYGRWTYKYEEAARRGAAGVLIVHETAPAAYGWATVQSSGMSPLFDIERSDADARAQHVPVRGWMQRALAVSLFKQAGLDFEQAKARAQQRDFAPVALGDATLSVDFKLKRERVVTHNVVAKLTGSQHPDETVIFSAHWDAFGIGKADASGETIRRGAVDNATGVASVLELARVFAAGPKPQRSLYFIALTAEEKGLAWRQLLRCASAGAVGQDRGRAQYGNVQPGWPDPRHRFVGTWTGVAGRRSGSRRQGAWTQLFAGPESGGGLLLPCRSFLRLRVWACRRSRLVRGWTWSTAASPRAGAARHIFRQLLSPAPATFGLRNGMPAAMPPIPRWSTTWAWRWPTAGSGRAGRMARSSRRSVPRAMRRANKSG